MDEVLPGGYVDVAEAASLNEGQGRTVEVKGRRLALFLIDGEFHAIADECPHRGGSLGAGWLEQGQVYCPLHGWAFDVRNGSCQTQPSRPVKTYAVRVQHGKVWVDLD